jgi:cytochrome P450
MERVQNPGEYKEKKDFMNGFLAAKEEYPNLVSDNEIIGYMMLNVRVLAFFLLPSNRTNSISQILGGADTTAILLKALVYHVVKHPTVQSTLVRELRTARSKSCIPPSVPLPHSVYSTLPYLQACIAEALRFHPVVGHILERVVPSSGLALSNGTTLPPGTIVGINPWIVTRDEKVYGERAEDFVPERWLRKKEESKEQFEGRIKIMKEADLAWGGGNRTCLGRPLALVELGKVGASLFGGYDVSFPFL